MRTYENYRRGPVIWCLMLVVTISLLVPAGVALAEDYKVDSIHYKNNGAYRVHVMIKVKDKDTGEVKGPFGGKCEAEDGTGGFSGEANWFNEGQHVECSLENVARAGDEVWLVIKINGGDTKSCRKSSKLYYNGGVRKYATFSSGGTSLNNNQCKWRGVKSY